MSTSTTAEAITTSNGRRSHGGISGASPSVGGTPRGGTGPDGPLLDGPLLDGLVGPTAPVGDAGP
ncbi:MAG: exosporium protein, partial [Micromonosporaceae bacterium]|nr:exosporium protein [Micromonosporaceae bacterium]